MDRIARCEVWSVLAHDWGMYGIAARLERMGFRGRPTLDYDTLEPEQQELYEANASVCRATGPYSRKLGQWS